MPNYNKLRGTIFEHKVKWVLQMLSFYVIRAYSSAGIADLVATPPWNPKGNYRPLLIQCKKTKMKDYVRPFERDHLSYMQQINSALVVVIYLDEGKVMVRYWENGKKVTIEEFLREEYGIPISSFSNISKSFREGRRPIHLYPVEKDENDKPVSSFTDLYVHDVCFPHVPEHYRDKHL